MLLQEVQDLLDRQVVQEQVDHREVLDQVALQDLQVKQMEVLDLQDQQDLVALQDLQEKPMEVLDLVVHQVQIQLFINMQSLFLILVEVINFM